jgi:hypothetical protein
MQFQNYIGQTLLFQIPKIHEVKYWKLKLLGVDPGGVWVESQDLTNSLLQAFNVPTMPKTPALFVPYHAISFAVAAMDVPALDEKAFGV